MTKALDAIENKMKTITSTVNWRDLGENLAEVYGYIDALRDFEHISEKDAGRLSVEARELRDAKESKLKEQEQARKKR